MIGIMNKPTDTSKCTHACHYCRVKKAKCNGETPCTNCLDRNEKCWYPVSRRGFRKRKERDETMAQKFERLEALVYASIQQRASPSESRMAPATPDRDSEMPDSTQSHGQFKVPNGLNAPFTQSSMENMVDVVTGSYDQTQSKSPAISSAPSPPPALSVSGTFTQPSPQTDLVAPMVRTGAFEPMSATSDTLSPFKHNQGEASLYPPSTAFTETVASKSPDESEEADTERPSHYLPIFAESAMEWVIRETGVPDFSLSARNLAADVLRNEKLDRTFPAERAQEPDFADAMRWTSLFFEGSPDALFGIILRSEFENRLRETFERGPSVVDDPAWYALRHTVYATGCRIALSVNDTPVSFNEARKQAWRLYENALAVHTDLLYGKTDLPVIQALVFMAFFAEGLGSRSLEYMLVSSASRLAQSIGLHLAVSPRSKIKKEEVLHRQYIWWVLYSYEKHLAWRSGRPSAIDDDDISCPVPTSVPENSGIHQEFFTSLVHHSQLNSEILKRLHTVKAMKKNAFETLDTLLDLEKKLGNWYLSIRVNDCVSSSSAPNVPNGLQMSHSTFLQFTYHGSLIAIHAPFAYPWNRQWHHAEHDTSILAQRLRSAEVVADSARSIIKATQRMQLSAASHLWLTFFYPLVGLINLFIYVIQNPRLPTAQSDIALMDVIVGHFGFLGYITGAEVTSAFPRKVVSIARQVVDRTSSNPSTQQVPVDGHFMPTYESMQLLTNGLPPLPELINFGPAEFGLEEWPLYCPQFPVCSPVLVDNFGAQRDIDSLLSHL